MKPQEIYIGQILVKYKVFGDVLTNEKRLIMMAEIERGNLSGTLGEKGWWIVKKEFRLNEYSL